MAEKINQSSVHREILKKAWEITWHNKWLWFLGLFAGFWETTAVYPLIKRSFDYLSQPAEAATSLWSDFQFFSLPSLSFLSSSLLSFLLFVLMVIVVALIVWLATASRGGLLFALNALIEGKKIKIRTALQEGTEKFWPLFWISLIGKIITDSLILTLGLLIIKSGLNFSSLKWWEEILYLLGFVVCALLFILVSFLVILALIYIMVQGAGIFKSIGLACRLFFKNWLTILELAFILYLIGVGLSLGIIILGLVFAIPIILLWLISIFLNLSSVFWVIFVIILIVLAVILLLLGVAFSVFQSSAWVLLFKRLTEEGALAKLIRLFYRTR
jgi:hypothetical protein